MQNPNPAQGNARRAVEKRRPNIGFSTYWKGHEIKLCVGFDPEAWPNALAPVEVFADTAKGGDIQNSVADACVLVSIALQYGIGVDVLAKSLAVAPEPDFDTGQMVDAPASPIGAVVNAIKARAWE
jgi:hypothetical protein